MTATCTSFQLVLLLFVLFLLLIETSHSFTFTLLTTKICRNRNNHNDLLSPLYTLRQQQQQQQQQNYYHNKSNHRRKFITSYQSYPKRNNFKENNNFLFRLYSHSDNKFIVDDDDDSLSKNHHHYEKKILSDKNNNHHGTDNNNKIAKQFLLDRRQSLIRTTLGVGTTAVTMSTTMLSHSNVVRADDDTKIPTPPPTVTQQMPTIVRPGGIARYDPIIVSPNTHSDDEYWKNQLQTLTTSIGINRIQLAKELSPLPQQLPLPFQSPSSFELYYPSYFFGSWIVTSQCKRKIYPYGLRYVPNISLINGTPRSNQEMVGNKCQYEQHYFSTLPNTVSNQIRVNTGTGVPESKIMADRAYNIISMSKGYKQLLPVQEVEWDYRIDPTKLILRYGVGMLTPDMRPLGQRRTEIYITARASSSSSSSSSEKDNDKVAESTIPPAFATAERYRVVTLAPGDVIVTDTETITEYQYINSDMIHAICRVVIYLVPNPNNAEGILWQQTNGKAVAMYDYEVIMERKKETFTVTGATTGISSTIKRACVETPKQIIQCE